MIQFLSWRHGAGAVVRRSAFAACCLVAAPVSAEQPISPAENLLFMTNHMQAIRSPVALTYSFKREGSAEADFDDQVNLDVSAIHPDKSVEVAMRFLSAGRTVELPPLSEANGNPVVLGFLERDTIEMKRLTGGSTNYFRKRIRLALAETKTLRPVRFTYAGKSREGQEIRIQPYLDDPLKDRFKGLADKSYTFIMSRDVPGSLYQIRTSTGGANYMDTPVPDRKPGITETLTLVGEKPFSAAKTNK